MGYPSTSTLVAASTVSELTGLTSAQQDALREAAIIAVESFCRQSFEAEGTSASPVTKKLDGTGRKTLYVPKRLSELTDITVVDAATGVSIDTADVSLNDRRDRLSIPEAIAGSSWADRAVAQLEHRERQVFPQGHDNIEVAGVWGWTDAEYPSAVTAALRYDMEDKALASAHKLSSTVRSARALGLESVSQGGLSVNLGSHEPDLSIRARRQLSDYVWVHTAGGTA